MIQSKIADPRDLRSVSAWFRSRRDKLLRKVILDARATVDGKFRILDIGGTSDYWRRVGFDFLVANDIDIVCVNHLATEFGNHQESSSRITYMVGDGCDLHEIADKSFDMVHSNSVIEHVGRWREMKRFAAEVHRVAKWYYVQTPNFWFPIDPHFYRVPMFHWLPEAIKIALLQRMKVGWAQGTHDVDRAMRLVESSVLLDRGRFRTLFPTASISSERFVGLSKSLIAIGQG